MISSTDTSQTCIHWQWSKCCNKNKTWVLIDTIGDQTFYQVCPIYSFTYRTTPSVSYNMCVWLQSMRMSVGQPVMSDKFRRWPTKNPFSSVTMSDEIFQRKIQIIRHFLLWIMGKLDCWCKKTNFLTVVSVHFTRLFIRQMFQLTIMLALFKLCA